MIKPPWWFCCGWWSPWCVLDVVTRCKLRWICNKHDAALTCFHEGRSCLYTVDLEHIEDSDAIQGHN